MARHSQLQAAFFVTPEGVAIPKAKPLPRRIKREVYERDGGKCTECGAEVARYGNIVSPFTPSCAAVDHIFPRARGGQNDLSNLRLTCTSCNASKGAA